MQTEKEWMIRVIKLHIDQIEFRSRDVYDGQTNCGIFEREEQKKESA